MSRSAPAVAVLILAAVLRLPFTVVRGDSAVYHVWPFAYSRPMAALTGYRLAIRSDEMANLRRPLGLARPC